MSELLARPGEQSATFVSGYPENMMYFIVYRDQIHSQPRLFKIAGDLQAPGYVQQVFIVLHCPALCLRYAFCPFAFRAVFGLACACALR